MKTKFIVLVILLFTFSIISLAQNQVTITPKKVKYTRTGEDVPEHKKTFEITYPIVTGIDVPLDEINKAISYWNNYDTTLKEINEDNFTYEMTYKVNYNGKGVLDLQLTSSGVGAYPWDSRKNIVIELSSGKVIKIKDAFKNRNKLYEMIAQAHTLEKKNAIKEKESEKFLIEDAARYTSIYEIEEFTVNDNGITFLFNYGFSFATLALQPKGEYFFTWEEMKPFISEYDSLSKFLKKK